MRRWAWRWEENQPPHLKLCMNCLNLSLRLDRATTMLMGMLAASTLSLLTFISGPKGRKRTRRRNSLLDSPLKISSYMVPLSFSVRLIPDVPNKLSKWKNWNLGRGQKQFQWQNFSSSELVFCFVFVYCPELVFWINPLRFLWLYEPKIMCLCFCLYFYEASLLATVSLYFYQHQTLWGKEGRARSHVTLSAEPELCTWTRKHCSYSAESSISWVSFSSTERLFVNCLATISREKNGTEIHKPRSES